LPLYATWETVTGTELLPGLLQCHIFAISARTAAYSRRDGPCIHKRHALARQLGARRFETEALVFQAELHLLAGRWAEALADAEEAVKMCFSIEGGPHPKHVSKAWFPIANSQFRCGPDRRRWGPHHDAHFRRLIRVL